MVVRLDSNVFGSAVLEDITLGLLLEMCFSQLSMDASKCLSKGLAKFRNVCSFTVSNFIDACFARNGS